MNSESLRTGLQDEGISTYTEDLVDIVNLVMGKIDRYIELVGGEQVGDGFRREKDDSFSIGHDLVKHYKNKLVDDIEFVFQELGRIKIERATYGQRDIKGGTRLGVVFKPAK